MRWLMLIEVNAEKHGYRVTMVMITNSLDTHSAVQQIPKEDIETVKNNIQAHLNQLLDKAYEHRKRT